MRSVYKTAEELFLHRFPDLSGDEYELFARAVLDSENSDQEKMIRRAILRHSPENIGLIILAASIKEAA
ncbi:MAG: hypothetical protein HQ538_01675 [Parcubacteria group bacterium]|nr:hypothetical protein [Parcubacteria group bacterium]